jgi:hypothetical protein
MQATCPNCQTRPADTLIHYDELVNRRYQRTSRQSSRGRVTVRSYSSVSDRGETTLCSVCAARYTGMVKMRERGLTLANRGFFALLVCMVLSVIVYNLSAGNGPAPYVAVALIGLCALAMLAGLAMIAASYLQRGSATRFMRKSASTASA